MNVYSSSATIRHNAGRSAVALCGFATALLASGSALADYYDYADYDYAGRGRIDFGFDGEGAAMVTSPRSPIGDTLTGGSGFKLRVGDRIWFPGVRLTPEVGYGYEHLWTSSDIGSYSWDTHRVFGGMRVAFGHAVSPGFYGHVGYGWRNIGDPTIADAGGVALDAGFALDFHLIRHFVFGAHAEYATIDMPSYDPQWVALGVHGDVVF
jgi:hypothetical protein